jgi:preprotein translocase subunit SecE
MTSQAERVRGRDMADGSSETRTTNALWERVMEHPRRWRSFLHEVRVEMRQVTWPTQHEVVTTTFVVIVAVAFFGVFFFGVDSTVGYVLQRVFSFFKAH